jgi:two-component system, OmpR family, response regulator
LIDMGLPDGSGADLIAEVAASHPRVDVILGMSGDSGTEAAAMAAGADGFLAKPFTRMAEFQSAILRHLPHERHPPGPRVLSDDAVSPDLIAYRDDLASIEPALRDATNLGYVTQFLDGVARSAGDRPMSELVAALAANRAAGLPLAPQVAALAALVRRRLDHAGPL